MEQDYITIDIRTILILLRKNIVLILVLTLLGAVAAFVISKYVITPQYQAEVTLIVNTRDDQATVITNDQINSAKQLVNTYSVVLTNDSLLEEVISELGLWDSAASLKKRISADAVNQTQVMRMTVRDDDPKTAQAVLEEIMLRAPDLLIRTVKAGSVEVISPPKYSSAPVSPNVMQNTVIGALAGLFLALAFIFIRKALTNTFITDEDVARHLELPVLGVIPSVRPQ